MTTSEGENPFARLAQYTRPDPDGSGVILDYNAVAMDAVVAAKLAGYSRKDLQECIDHFWAEITVDVKKPPSARN